MTPHMSPADFRAHSHRAIDFIEDYLERLESFPVLSKSKPGEIYNALPAHAPELPDISRAELKNPRTCLGGIQVSLRGRDLKGPRWCPAPGLV